MPGNETKEEALQAKKEVKEATSVDWNNVFQSIITGSAPEAKSSASNKGGILEPEPISMDLNAFAESQASSLGIKSSSKNLKIDAGPDLTPIFYEINRYKFSSVNMQKDVEETAALIRKTLQKRIASKILKNSKSVCSYVEEFFQYPEGMRGVYNILGNKYSMKATGEFSGEEFLYCAAQDNEIVGGVFMKNDQGKFVDISNKFQISITKL